MSIRMADTPKVDLVSDINNTSRNGVIKTRVSNFFLIFSFFVLDHWNLQKYSWIV